MRYRSPSPYEELEHTADVGVVARGATLAEAYARAALGMSQLMAGGGAVEEAVERPLVARGEDPASLLVDLCRQVHERYFRERLLLAAIDVDEVGDERLVARGWFGLFDPARHGEGADIKAVTYARAAVVPEGQGFRATVLFDI